MTNDEASMLEREFGVVFPDAYRRAIIDSYPFNDATEELDTDAGSLRALNVGYRRENPWGFPWQAQFWSIGGDGAGGFYFIDTRQRDSTIYYCDHEDMPESFDDHDRLYVRSFPEFIDDIQQLEKKMEKWESERKEQIANRKWWQFWISRQCPPRSKGSTSE